VETRLAVRLANAAAGELHPHVGDIHLLGENADAGGANFLRPLAGERQNDVDIVNHQVEHDVPRRGSAG